MNQKEPVPIDQAFGLLRAEQEPWLGSVYFPPAHPAALTVPRSTLISGERGSGKSALLLWLSLKAREQKYLPVFWRWDPFTWSDEIPLETQKHLLSTLLFELARTLFVEIGCNQENWGKLLPTTRQWFLYFFAHHLSSHSEWSVTIPQALMSSAENLLAEVQKTTLPGWGAALSPLAELGYLIPALTQAGYQGVVVLIEDIAIALESAPHLKRFCTDFLAFVALFDIPGLYFKIAADESLHDLASHSPVVTRRRVELYRLQWSESALEAMVNRRLELALGQNTTLADLYKREALIRWLATTGGHTPQGWLEALAPLVFELEEKRQTGAPLSPLSSAAWREFRLRHLPALHYDATEGSVTLGWRKTFLSPGEDALFQHLWDRRGKLCSREELYQVYSQRIYGVQDENYYPSDYRAMLDTALYRLREAIEPDPEDPILIITRRGKGIYLTDR